MNKDNTEFVALEGMSDIDDLSRANNIALAAMGEYERTLVVAFIHAGGRASYEDMDDLLLLAEERCVGQYDSDEDMAWEYLDGSGIMDDVPEELQGYIDVKKYARDMMTTMMSADGFYFNNHS